MTPADDILSPTVRQLLGIDVQSAYTELVPPRAGSDPARQVLQGLDADSLLVVPVRNRDEARAMLAGLWLWHDRLDESHTISQSISSQTGSFWHAIMHRREGDFSNSKYWNARCAGHPVLQTLGVQAPAVLNPHAPHKTLLRVLRGGWNPNAFVDLVEDVHRDPQDSRHLAAVSLQQLEWRLLFEHCTRQAAG